MMFLQNLIQCQGTDQREIVLDSITSWNFTGGAGASLSTRSHLLKVDNPTPGRPAKSRWVN
jgi:hypothetical protein